MPSRSGPSKVTPGPTCLAWAATSATGPSHMPIRQPSSAPTRPPTASATTSGTPPRRRKRKTAAAVSAPKASESRMKVPSAAMASSPSVFLR